jgi:hypothetical protein
MGTGDQSGTWGNTTNLNLGTFLEQAIAGYVTQPFASANVQLSLVNGADAGGNTSAGSIYTTGTTSVPVSARNMYISCTGTTTSVTGNYLCVPANTKLYYVANNTTGGPVIVSYGSAGTPTGTNVSIPVGYAACVICTGSNVVQAESYFSSFSAAAINNTPIGATTPSTGKFTTVNGNTFTTGTYTLTGTAAKTLNFTNTLTLSGTDSTVMTFPTTTATIARTDAAQTFTGTQTVSQITSNATAVGGKNLLLNGFASGNANIGMATNSGTGTLFWITAAGNMLIGGNGASEPSTAPITISSAGVVAISGSPTFVTPVLGTPTSGTLSNCTVDGTAGNNVGFINLPQLSKTSAYVLAAADRGKHISITTGGVTVNVSTFAAGDAVTIYNNSASSQTITQGTSATMYLAGTATTGNRTLAQRGVCTILCVTGGASAVYVISGGGLT